MTAPQDAKPITGPELGQLEVDLEVRLDRRRVPLQQVLQLLPGAVLPLEKAADEPLELRVNGQTIGWGRPVRVGDRYGIQVTRLRSTGDLSSRNDEGKPDQDGSEPAEGR